MKPILLSLFVSVALLGACSDPPGKNGSDNAKTGEDDIESWCRDHDGFYECDPDSGFAITYSHSDMEECVVRREMELAECDISLAEMRECVAKIEQCPDTQTVEEGQEAFALCDPWLDCMDYVLNLNSSTNNIGTNNDAMNNVSMNNVGTNNNSGGEEFTTQFIAVTEVVRANCLLGGCHDASALSEVHVVPQGQQATPGEIAEVYSRDTPTASGLPLITPGDPSSSEIYVRITKPAGDTQLMGAGSYGAAATPLSAQDIETIETWIVEGAQFSVE